MASGTLFTYPNNFRAFKALIASQYSGANVKVDSSFKFGETNKGAEFLKSFPLGKVPAFKSDDGICVFESNAIANFVSNDDLIGKTKSDAALVQQWINFSDNELLPAVCTWVFPCLGITQFNKNDAEKSKAQLTKALTVLNGHLLSQTFLVGERVTLADISVACNLLLAYQHVMESQFRSPFQNVNRWFTTCINQSEFKKVIGEFKLCEKMAQFDAKKYAELHGGEKKDKKKDEKKKEKPAQAPKKEKKKEEEEVEEEEDAPRKDDKDPFAAFPKGTFVFDEFKRVYSNEDTVTKAIPWFWEHFDSENNSVWFGEYLFPEELKKIYMTCNLVGGMHQRLDKLRKNAFGSCCIFGEDNKNHIAGIWFWRGQDLAFGLSDDWQVDCGSYKWTKLDPKTDENKKLINDYLSWDCKYQGMKFNQGKIFK